MGHKLRGYFAAPVSGPLPGCLTPAQRKKKLEPTDWLIFLLVNRQVSRIKGTLEIENRIHVKTASVSLMIELNHELIERDRWRHILHHTHTHTHIYSQRYTQTK